MKGYADVLIVSGSVIAAILFLISFHKRAGRKKRIEHPTAAKGKDNTLPSNGHHDAEQSLNVDTDGEAKYDGTAFVAEAALAAVITAATVANLSSEGEVGLGNSIGGDNATFSSADGDGYGGGESGGGAGCGSG